MEYNWYKTLLRFHILLRDISLYAASAATAACLGKIPSNLKLNLCLVKDNVTFIRVGAKFLFRLNCLKYNYSDSWKKNVFISLIYNQAPTINHRPVHSIIPKIQKKPLGTFNTKRMKRKKAMRHQLIEVRKYKQGNANSFIRLILHARLQHWAIDRVYEIQRCRRVIILAQYIDFPDTSSPSTHNKRKAA